MFLILVAARAESMPMESRPVANAAVASGSMPVTCPSDATRLTTSPISTAVVAEFAAM